MPDDHDSPRDRIASALVGAAEIVRRLRAPGGCPWDREQTPSSLKPFVVEEAYEVLDAIDGGNPDELREELGDLLLQILLQAEIARERGAFDVADVAEGLSRKLVHRHPHVFGDVAVEGSDQVLVNWEKIKKKEKANRGLFDGLPASLPALLRAARMGEKAGRVGFDWPSAQGVRAKIDEELAEADEAARAGVPADLEHELGDVLFAVAQWARHLGCQPEEALRGCCARFSRRFAGMERILADRGKAMTECTLDEMEAAWQEAKRQ
jgi:tetrapyrrole methylase family protein / MazG family protein